MSDDDLALKIGRAMLDLARKVSPRGVCIRAFDIDGEPMRFGVGRQQDNPAPLLEMVLNRKAEVDF